MVPTHVKLREQSWEKSMCLVNENQTSIITLKNDPWLSRGALCAQGKCSAKLLCDLHKEEV